MIDQLSRRAFVSAGAMGAALVWLLPHAAAHAAGAQRPLASALTTGELADLEAVTALIIPSDEVPGAREAGAAHYIDRALSTWAASQRPIFTDGLRSLNEAAARRAGSSRFARLEPDIQRPLLAEVQDTPFFHAVRFATLAGMFCHPSHGGNRGQVGWRLIGYEERHAWQPPFGFYDSPAALEP